MGQWHMLCLQPNPGWGIGVCHVYGIILGWAVAYTLLRNAQPVQIQHLPRVQGQK